MGQWKKLAAKPKPWRINLILHITYSAWLLIKTKVIQKFQASKDIEYRTFIDLLDNLIPLMLEIYANLFVKDFLIITLNLHSAYGVFLEE